VGGYPQLGQGDGVGGASQKSLPREGGGGYLCSLARGRGWGVGTPFAVRSPDKHVTLFPGLSRLAVMEPFKVSSGDSYHAELA
jgi:hypothetical protein